jgi:hypothetical protein
MFALAMSRGPRHGRKRAPRHAVRTIVDGAWEEHLATVAETGAVGKWFAQRRGEKKKGFSRKDAKAPRYGSGGKAAFHASRPTFTNGEVESGFAASTPSWRLCAFA